MKIFTTTAFALLFGQILFAQTTLSGTLRDENWEPLPFASVQLLDASTDQTVKNGTTDSYGQYQFGEVAPGKYFIKAKLAALGEVISSKTAIGSRPVAVCDLQFPKNAAGRAKKSAFADLPREKAEADEMVFLKE